MRTKFMEAVFCLLLAGAAITADASPCTNCLERAQRALAMCMASATTTAAQTRCQERLQADLKACSASACSHVPEVGGGGSVRARNEE